MSQALDLTRLAEVNAFLQDGEEFKTTCGDYKIELRKWKMWVWVGVSADDAVVGRNLNGEMQKPNNFEYWVLERVRALNKMLGI